MKTRRKGKPKVALKMIALKMIQFNPQMKSCFLLVGDGGEGSEEEENENFEGQVEQLFGEEVLHPKDPEDPRKEKQGEV